MHDQADRHLHSSSMLSTSPNRLLNLQQAKLARPAVQQNAAKKLKVNHVNGAARPGSTPETASQSATSVRRKFSNSIGSLSEYYIHFKSFSESVFLKT